MNNIWFLLVFLAWPLMGLTFYLSKRRADKFTNVSRDSRLKYAISMTFVVTITYDLLLLGAYYFG